ncbi:MAG: hypothetical protein KDA42_10620 [Planctomycetales bacterium]|nr:hypothetical protein [Planctomycetales bacterium]
MWPWFELLITLTIVFVPLGIIVLAVLEIARIGRRPRWRFRFTLRTLFTIVTTLCITISLTHVAGGGLILLAPFVWIGCELLLMTGADLLDNEHHCHRHIIARRPGVRMRKWWRRRWPFRYTPGRSCKIHEVDTP